MNNNKPSRAQIPRNAPVTQKLRGASQCPAPGAVLPVMAFVPDQTFGEVYSECQALHTGTLFPALDKPFSGKGCRR